MPGTSGPNPPPDPGLGPFLEVNDRFRPRTDRAFLARVVAAALAEVERPELRVSLLLTDDEELSRLHGEYLNDPTPTDVLSFASGENVDIAISVECARTVARRRGHFIRAEVALYVVHGILHACGHDDREDDARARMREAEQRVLQSIGLTVAPVDD